jgi:hypothetical protein
MKASEIIENLQRDIEFFGDQEVAFTCDDVEDGEPQGIGGFGFYSGKDGEKATLLVCGDCHHRAVGEKHMFDGDEETLSSKRQRG